MTDEEITRWQERIQDITGKYNVDGGGCDSGDPLDFSAAEIQMALAKLEDEKDELSKTLSDKESIIAGFVDLLKNSEVPGACWMHDPPGDAAFEKDDCPTCKVVGESASIAQAHDNKLRAEGWFQCIEMMKGLYLSAGIPNKRMEALANILNREAKAKAAEEKTGS